MCKIMISLAQVVTSQSTSKIPQAWCHLRWGAKIMFLVPFTVCLSMRNRKHTLPTLFVAWYNSNLSLTSWQNVKVRNLPAGISEREWTRTFQTSRGLSWRHLRAGCWPAASASSSWSHTGWKGSAPWRMSCLRPRNVWTPIRVSN